MKIVYSTFPDEKSYRAVGEKLLEDRLIACYNAFRISSGYWWEEKIVRDEEWGVFFKTRDELVEDVSKKIKELHPYTTPAIFTIDIGYVHPDYDRWLHGETGGESGEVDNT